MMHPETSQAISIHSAPRSMKHKALDILDRLTRADLLNAEKPTDGATDGRGRSDGSREKRLTELLRDPESDQGGGWFMYVPRCFNDALDIRQRPRVIDGRTTTVWTQGSTLAFKPGDLIYDTERAYGEWSEALRHVGVAVQVKSATDAVASQPGVDRAPGSVTFDVLLPSADRSMLVSSGCLTLTQDGFVRMLITGDGLPRRQE